MLTDEVKSFPDVLHLFGGFGRASLRDQFEVADLETPQSLQHILKSTRAFAVVLLEVSLEGLTVNHVQDGEVVDFRVFCKLDVLHDVVGFGALRKYEKLHVERGEVPTLHAQRFWKICIPLLEKEGLNLLEIECPFVTHDHIQELQLLLPIVMDLIFGREISDFDVAYRFVDNYRLFKLECLEALCVCDRLLKGD